MMSLYMVRENTPVHPPPPPHTHTSLVLACPLTEGLSEATGPLLVKILKPRGASLGLSLRESPAPGDPLWISRLKEAGIADRCGALHIGDQLLSVNGVPLENKPINEIYHMLRHCDLHVELEIFPAHNVIADRSEGMCMCISNDYVI